MSALEALRTILVVAGALLAAPVIMLIVRLSVFLGGLKSAVEGIAQSARDFTQRVNDRLETLDESSNDHETRISVVESKVGLNRRWNDGPDK